MRAGGRSSSPALERGLRCPASRAAWPRCSERREGPRGGVSELLHTPSARRGPKLTARRRRSRRLGRWSVAGLALALALAGGLRAQSDLDPREPDSPATGPPSATPTPGDSPAARLRAAWILHRLAGQPIEARAGYRALVEDAAVPPNIRARAALGLALSWREVAAASGVDESTAGDARRRAQRWLEFVRSLEGASPRWKAIARGYLDELRRDSRPLLQDLDALVRQREEQLAGLHAELHRRRVRLRRWEGSYQRLRDHLSRRGVDLRFLSTFESDGAGEPAVESWLDPAAEAPSATAERLIAGYLERARTALRGADYAATVDWAGRALRADPFHPEARLVFRRGQAGVEVLRESPGALDLARSAAAKEFVHGLEEEMSEGERLEELGRIAEAIDHYDRVLQWYASETQSNLHPDCERLALAARARLDACFGRASNVDEAQRLARRGGALEEGLDEIARAYRRLDRELSTFQARVGAIRRRHPEELAAFGRIEAAGLGFAAEHASSPDRRLAQREEWEDIQELIPEVGSPRVAPPK